MKICKQLLDASYAAHGREDSHAKERGQIGTLDFSKHIALSKTLQTVSVKPTFTQYKRKADHICEQC